MGATLQKNWKWHATVIGAAALLALSACGGDDDNANASEPVTAAVQPSDAPTADAAFCDAIVDGNASVAELAAAAPEEIRADVTAMADESGGTEVAAGMTGGPSSDEFFAAATSVGDYVADNCGYQVIDVTATEYALKGIPADAVAGKTLIRITNEGTEYHEVALQRIRAGETRSVEEILALPDNEGGDLLDYLDHAFAPPGRSNWFVVDLSAGRYAVMCYVATGATPESVQSGQFDDMAPSHTTKGEFAEIQVS